MGQKLSRQTAIRFGIRTKAFIFFSVKCLLPDFNRLPSRPSARSQRAHKTRGGAFSGATMTDPITTAEAAALLGVTPNRVKQYIEDGRLPAKKFARAWMIERRDVAKVGERKAGRPRLEK